MAAAAIMAETEMTGSVVTTAACGAAAPLAACGAAAPLAPQHIESLRTRPRNPLQGVVPANTIVWTLVTVGRGKGVWSACSLVRGDAGTKVIVGLHTHDGTAELEAMTAFSHYMKTMADDPFLVACAHVLFVEAGCGGALSVDLYLRQAKRVLPQIAAVSWFADITPPEVRSTLANMTSASFTLIDDMRTDRISIYQTLNRTSANEPDPMLDAFMAQCARLRRKTRADGRPMFTAATDTLPGDLFESYVLACYYSHHVTVREEAERTREEATRPL